MSSRREEERNEKIIRGLMKLPPNRRCINCNSLGPQYVCTNFWTFVCMTCSGIHREFTHRVKSVSMAKFTSQEVEALQNGGNQRAREFFLKDWDSQRQRLPDSSNADKVREFIKNVYVDRRVAGGKTSSKPPRDMHNVRNHEDETRRSSSYHSYSQSPPYEYQYEERRYGKQAPVLTRKPGSDRGLYEGKVSSFFSPGRLSDHMFEDRFANEGPNPRVSDYSVLSGGDPIRSDIQLSSFQRDIGFNSPSSDTSRDFTSRDFSNDYINHHTSNTFSDANSKKFADHVPRPQRTTSLSSIESFETNSMSLKSVNSITLADVASEPEQNVGTQQNKLAAAPSLLPSSASGNFGGLDLFNAPFASQTVGSTASAINLFESPGTLSTPSMDYFQPPPLSSVTNFDSNHPSLSLMPSSLDLLSEMPQQQPSVTLNEKPPDALITNNEGWATFDKQQQSAAMLNEKLPDAVTTKGEGWATFDVPQQMTPDLGIENSTSAEVSSTNGGSMAMFDQHLFGNTSLQWPAFQDSGAYEPSSLIPNLWHDSLHIESSLNAHSTQDFNKNVIQRTAADTGPPSAGVLLDDTGTSYIASAVPVLAGVHPHATNCRSMNPFDLPDDSDMESSNMFLDMSCLQTVLPIGGATQPWFSENPMPSYMPAGAQGAIGFMSGQVPTTKIPNVPTQGPVASIGGNPFA